MSDLKLYFTGLTELIKDKPQINIYGNSRTKDKVIRREIPFVEGDAINNELIRIANRNLNNLGIFKKISTHMAWNFVSRIYLFILIVIINLIY